MAPGCVYRGTYRGLREWTRPALPRLQWEAPDQLRNVWPEYCGPKCTDEWPSGRGCWGEQEGIQWDKEQPLDQ